MRKPILHSQQRGQAIVLVAFVMVALIASLGLAIDGGGIFLLYRDVQNATDAAALSAAFAKCTGDNVQAAGERAARENGFENGINGATVNIVSPPAVGSPFANDDAYIEIEIIALKPSYFIQVVYPGPLEVAARTYSRCVGGNDFGLPPEAAIVNLKNDCGNVNDEGSRAQGSNETIVVGTIYSRQPGGAGCTAIGTGGGGTFTVDGEVCSDANIEPGAAVYDADGNPVDHQQPCTDAGTVTDDPLGLVGNEPQCDRTVSYNLSDYDGGTAPAGYYPSGNFKLNNGSVELGTGIYCIEGSVNNLTANITTEDGGITIFHDCTPGANCSFNPSACNGCSITLTASETGEYAGLLFFSDSQKVPTNAHQWNAQTSLYLTGTVYAPFSECQINGGSSNNVIIGQFICWNLTSEGNSDVTIIYDPSVIYSVPPEFGIAQ